MSFRLLKIYLRDIGNHLIRLSAEEERILINQLKSGDWNVMNALVRCNQYIVFEEVLYFVRMGIPITELIQIANFDLVKSLIRYCNENINTPLKNYLHRNIYRNLQNSCNEYRCIIRIPLNIVSKLNEMKNEFTIILSDDTCTDFLTNRELIEKILECDPIILSISDYIDENEYLVSPILLFNKDEPNDELIIQESLKQEIQSLLLTLKKRECDVIKMYFGIEREFTLTLNEIGKTFGLTRERIRQILENAIKRMKHKSRSKILKQFVTTTAVENEINLCLDYSKIFLQENVCLSSQDEELCINCIKQYLKPFRRTTSYPDIKNLSSHCRKLLVQILKRMERPCSYDELKDSLYEEMPLLSTGNFEYALRTEKEIVKIGRGLFGLKDWGYFDYIETDNNKKRSNITITEIINILKTKDRPIGIKYLLSLLTEKYNLELLSRKEENRILRMIKSSNKIYRTLDNRFYFWEDKENDN